MKKMFILLALALTFSVGKGQNNPVLTVNYSESLEQMISAGNYVYNSMESILSLPSNLNLIAPELIGKVVKYEAKLFNFNENLKTQKSIEKMDSAGYRPATISELLALGRYYKKEIPNNKAIVALGSFLVDKYGDNANPYIIKNRKNTEIKAICNNDYWAYTVYYLGVKKQ
ncbi:MAG: hypothetical protein WC564_03385 [Patescibacteria group bacterium]|jgi:hypothetical protein